MQGQPSNGWKDHADKEDAEDSLELQPLVIAASGQQLSGSKGMSNIGGTSGPEASGRVSVGMVGAQVPVIANSNSGGEGNGASFIGQGQPGIPSKSGVPRGSPMAAQGGKVGLANPMSGKSVRDSSGISEREMLLSNCN